MHARTHARTYVRRLAKTKMHACTNKKRKIKYPSMHALSMFTYPTHDQINSHTQISTCMHELDIPDAVGFAKVTCVRLYESARE
jgi:hypothetical protein